MTNADSQRPPVIDRQHVLEGPRVPPLLRAMRPLQWTKNGLVFSALIFAQNMYTLSAILETIAAVAIFCAVSSGIYLVNDLRDVEHDRHHPRKKNRPIASGALSVRTATVAAAVLLIGGLAAAVALRPLFALVIVLYIVLMVAYSYGLKRLVIIDVFAIAAGFVLRAAGGAVAIAVPISPWLYFCTMLGALFIGFGKRRNELVVLEGSASAHRISLDHYTVGLLDQIIGIVASAVVMAYSLYTFDAPTVPQNHAMMLTIPFVLYGLFRYLYLIYRRHLGGSPEVIFATDKPLALSIVLWAVASVLILQLS